MKLIKKILPIIAATSAASIVVPLTTSCGGMSDFDYTPSIPMHETITYDTLSAAQGEYFSQVKNNPEILVQDYYWTIAQNAKKEKAELIERYKDVSFTFDVKASFSNINSTTIEGQTIYFLSGSTSQNIHMQYTSEDTSSGKKVTTTETIDSSSSPSCEKVAFTIINNSGSWLVKLYLPQNYTEDWSIKTDGNMTNSSKIVSDNEEHYTEQKQNLHASFNKDNPIAYWELNFFSYYFQNVKI